MATTSQKLSRELISLIHHIELSPIKQGQKKLVLGLVESAVG